MSSTPIPAFCVGRPNALLADRMACPVLVAGMITVGLLPVASAARPALDAATMDGGWRSVARGPAGATVFAGLAQMVALWVDLGLAHTDLILLVVLEFAAGFLVGQVVAGWLSAMTGALIGGTIVVTSSTDLVAGQIGPALLVALFLALLLFAPGYLLGSAKRSLDDAAYGVVPDRRMDEMTPAGRIASALVILAADVGIVVWALTTLRLPGP